MEEDNRRELNEWADRLAAAALPRWEELPDIELYMDQVVALLDKHFARFPGGEAGKLISPSIINNYVKMGAVPPTIKKRYSRTHLAYLMIICILKPVLPIAAIQGIIEAQLRSRALDEVYNHFCEEQESAARLIREQIQGGEPTAGMLVPAGERLSDLSLRMAVLANAGKIFAEKIVALEQPPEEAEAKEKGRKRK